MSADLPENGLLSRLTAPLARVARRVARHPGDAPQDTAEEEQIPSSAEDTSARTSPDKDNSMASPGSQALTAEDFRLAIEQLLHEDAGRYGIKIQVVSLAEFHEAVGDRWLKFRDKVMLIAEGVINLHLGAGNAFGRQGEDFFLLLFRTVPPMESYRRAVTIAQELGTRLVGDQFVGLERPLAVATEVDSDDLLLPHAEGLNLDAVTKAVAVARAKPPPRLADPSEMPSWMRNSGPEAPPPPPEGPLPAALTSERQQQPGKDPGWQAIQVVRKESPVEWKPLPNSTPRVAGAENGDQAGQDETFSVDVRLGQTWRPVWISAQEQIAAYRARIQRTDHEGGRARHGEEAYPQDGAAVANALDRFLIAQAIRELRNLPTGNEPSIIIPIHWQTLTATSLQDLTLPFADVTEEVRRRNIVIDIFALPHNVTARALTAAIKTAHGLAGRVAVQSTLTAPHAEPIADCGADLVSYRYRAADFSDSAHDLTLLERFMAAALRARIKVCLWSLPRRQLLSSAVRVGCAMIDGPALMKDLPHPGKVIPAPRSRLLGT